jgi:hypothetical protein
MNQVRPFLPVSWISTHAGNKFKESSEDWTISLFLDIAAYTFMRCNII